MPGEKLLCIDFDETMVNGHFHSTLQDRGVPPHSDKPGVQVLTKGKFVQNGAPVLERQNAGATNHVQGLLTQFGPKHGEQMAAAIRQALQHGHKVAIVSFTLYPEVVRPTLEKIGLTEAEINEVCIVGGFPSHNKPDRSPDGKREHIKAARDHFAERGVNINEQDVMLVDDSEWNVARARESGLQWVNVPKHANPDLTQDNYFEKINVFTAQNLRVQISTRFEAIAPIVQPPTTQSPLTQKTAILSHFQAKSAQRSAESHPLSPATTRINLGVGNASVKTFSGRPNKMYLLYTTKDERNAAAEQMQKGLGDICRPAGKDTAIEIDVSTLLKKMGIDLPPISTFPDRENKVYLDFPQVYEKGKNPRDAARNRLIEIFGQDICREATLGNRLEIYPLVLLKTLEAKPKLLQQSQPKLDLGTANVSVKTFSDRPNKTYLEYATKEARDAAANKMVAVLGALCHPAGRATNIEIDVSGLLKKTTGADFPAIRTDNNNNTFLEFATPQAREDAKARITQVFGQDSCRVDPQSNRLEVYPITLLKAIESKPGLLKTEEEKPRAQLH